MFTKCGGRSSINEIGNCILSASWFEDIPCKSDQGILMDRPSPYKNSTVHSCFFVLHTSPTLTGGTKCTRRSVTCRLAPSLSEVKLSHGAENRVVTTDGRTELIVLRLRVTYLVKVRLKWKIVQKTTDVILTNWHCVSCHSKFTVADFGNFHKSKIILGVGHSPWMRACCRRTTQRTVAFGARWRWRRWVWALNDYKF